MANKYTNTVKKFDNLTFNKEFRVLKNSVL